MGLAISRMEEKWNRYEQLYDSFHGEYAYKERYGYIPTFDDDEYDNMYNDNSSDEYESEYESE